MAKRKQDPQSAARRRQERRSEKLRREMLLCVVVGGLALLGVLCMTAYRLTFTLDVFAQKGTALRVNGTALAPADYDFYFYRAYYEYMNNAGDEVSGIGGKPDETIPLDRQVLYSEDGETVTWQDFFDSRAQRLIRQTYFYYDLAQKAGYTLTEEQEADIQYDFDEKIWFEAQEIEQIGVEPYLKQHYGPSMTEAIYRRDLRILFTANFYMDQCRNTIEIDPQELDDYYAAHAADYHMVFYRLFYLQGKTEETRARAEELAQAASEADFIALCDRYQSYNGEDSHWTGGSRLHREQTRFSLSYFRDWFPTAAPGDTAVAEAANGCYIVMLLGASDNDYPVADLQYFTISGEDAQARGFAFLREWAAGEGTAESFFALSDGLRDIDYTTEYRKSGSITYLDQDRSTVPACMAAWCFDHQRSSGDTAAFAGEDGRAYVVRFDGYGDLCRRRLVYKELSAQRFQSWNEEALAGVSLEEGFFHYLLEA